MSRRKQPKPRHLEAENDLAALLEDGTQPRSPASPAIGDAHVCGKCRAEFLDLSEFLTHKKNCSQKRIVVLYDDAGKASENVDDEDDDVVAPLHPTSPKLLMNGDDLGDDLVDDDLDKVAESSAADDSLDAMATLEKSDFADNKSDIGSNDGDDFESPNIDGDLNDDDVDDAMDDMDDSMDMDKFNKDMTSSKELINPLLKPEIPHMFPFGLPGFPGFPPVADGTVLSDSNVKLASLEGTKVAMAQFAENNLANLPPNTDVATLQSMLFSLHQQQVLQLQLLQQLQHQLMSGMAPSMAASIQAQVLGQYLLPQTTPSAGTPAPKHMAPHPPQPTSTTTAPTPAPHGVTNAIDSIAKSTTTAPTSVLAKTPPMALSRSESTTSSSLPPTPPFEMPPSASKSVMNAMTEATSRMLMNMTAKDVGPSHNFPKEGKVERPQSPLPPTPARSPTRPVKEAGTILDRAQYAADDPFFKHKCRFCHKVFGSDSGLQIHIRSHTGERPFKCNICGNRFSTRGNLKVHFARHKAKYPHVKMNPHPMPEHLERLSNNPILVAPMPAMNDRDMLPPSLMPAEKKPRLEQPPFDRQRPGSAENSNSSSGATRLSVTSPASSSGGHGASSAVHSPTPAASEAPARSSPNVSDTAAMTTSSLNLKAEPRSEVKTTPSRPSSHSSPGHSISSSSGGSKYPSIPMGSPNTPGSSGAMLMSPHHPIMSMAPTPMMVGMPGMSHGMPPFNFPEAPFFAPPSILPSNEEDPMEQYMEVSKSETSKLEQLVQNLETKLTDPNQCAICHRILSCKSALQMHYRTHTGERPFKCKICGRAFTTKGNLKTHMGVHRAKPPMRMLHQCPVCHKQFTNALVLQQHIRMHTGEINKDMPSLMPVPASMGDMMPGPFMPFPGFPFMPPMYPHPGNHQLQNNHGHSVNNSSDQVGNSGELDLRKPASVKKSDDGTNSEAGSEKKDGSMDHDKMEFHGSEDNMSSAGSSNNEAFGMDGPELIAKAEKHADESHMDDADMESESQPPRSPAAESENHDAPSRSSLLSETEMKNEHGGHVSPFSSASTTPTPTPPASKAMGDFKPPNEYLSLFNQASSSESFLPTSTSSYSTSLMALEERVKAIEAPNPLYSYNSQRPLEQMANIVRRQEGEFTPPGGAGSSHSHSPGAASQPDLDSGNTSPASATHKDGASIGGSLSPSSQTSQGNLNSSSPFYPSKMDRDTALFGFPPGMGMSPYKGFGALDLTPRLYGSGRTNTTCNICYKTFACKSALDIHFRSHTKDRPFKCEVCERCFSTRGNMKQHMLTHKIRDLPSEAFNQQQQPEQENQQIPGSPRPKSDITPPTTPIKEDVDHRPSHSSIPSSPSEAGKHQPLATTTTPPSAGSTSTPTTPSGSGAASTSSSTSSSSSSAMSNSNSLDSPFVRRPNPKHICQMCNKPFSSASALQIHIRTHTGDKPFKCTICGKAFTTKGNLKVHMGTHMWNNSPSRRGRRMSMDTLPGFPGVHTGVPPRPDEPSHFFNNFAHRPPQPPHHPPPPHGAEMYPFFPGFPNGFSPKMNEISVIQSINGNMGHLPGHPHPPVTSEGGLMGRPVPSMTDSMAKHPAHAPESPMKSPTNLSSISPDTMLKPPMLKTEMKSPDSFLMKAREPHVIAPHEAIKMDIPHRPAEHAPVASPEKPKPPKAESNNNNPHPLNNGTGNTGGELDLSLPHKPSMPSPISSAPSPPVSNHNNTSPPSSTPPAPVAAPLPPPPPPPPPMSPMSPPGMQTSPDSATPWMWRGSKVCASPAGLERHIKAHMPPHTEESSPKPLMT